MNIYHETLVIEKEDYSIYGVLRSPSESTSEVIIFIPAVTGTRIGPQRMFVEMSHYICQYGIATLCIDTPLYGDSYTKLKVKEKDFFSIYFSTLDIVLEYMRLNYHFDNILLASISLGCIPALEFAEEKGLDKVILLSPNHLEGNQSLINKQNLRVYIQKMFNIRTWSKLLRLKINYKKVITNVFHRSRIKLSSNNMPHQKNKVNVLCVFGEKDVDLEKNNIFWTRCTTEKRFLSYTQKIITNADHSFMGWNSKRLLESAILKWLK